MKTKIFHLFIAAIIIVVNSCFLDENENYSREHFYGCWEYEISGPYGKGFMKYTFYHDSVRYDYLYPVDSVKDPSGMYFHYVWNEIKFDSWRVKYDSLYFENGAGFVGNSRYDVRTVTDTIKGLKYAYGFKQINKNNLEFKIDSATSRLFTKCVN